MEFQPNKSLRDANFLRLDATAAWYCAVTSPVELEDAVQFAENKQLPILVLGDGSNVVLAGELEQLVVRNNMQGVTYSDTCVTAAGGENWHQLVKATVEKGLFGLENLALIPGSVGAAPVQNIGAYGVELVERFRSLTAMHLPTGEFRVFDTADCEFSYRDSLFRKSTDWFITEVCLNVSANLAPVITYPDVETYLATHNLSADGGAVFDAVTQIRTRKLPNPAVTPNVGSFFKNPIVSQEEAAQLASDHADMPVFDAPAEPGLKKIPAGWLIDKLGLKGFTVGGMAVSEQHALVVTNLGSGSFDELAELVRSIRADVKKAFGIDLEIEPRIYPESAL